MRLFEILLVAFDLLAVFWLAAKPTKTLPVRFGVLLLALHLLLERYRWQMVPVYALTGLLALALLARGRRRATRARPWLAALGGLAGALLIALAAAPAFLFPVPRLPEPNGPYAIGVLSYHWTDPARAEAYAPEPGIPREVMAQVWYPAAPAPGARPAPWMERLDVVGPVIARYIRLPGFALDHLALTRANAIANAPLAPGGRFPVVIYSHGWNGFRTVNADQSEALASHGYVVVAVEHTYGAMFTLFPDGRVALNNPAALPSGVPEAEYQRATEQLEATYAGDIRFVMDQLERLEAGEIGSPFAGRLDLARLGVFGHSTGGGAAVIACHADARCRAGLGMDAWLGPVPAGVIAAGVAQPFLFMRSETWATARNDALLDQLYGRLRAEGYRLTIRGTRHYDFTLLPLLTPLAPALKLKGPLAGERVLEIVDTYLVAFFDRHLKGEAQPLLDGPSPEFPEVAFERRGP